MTVEVIRELCGQLVSEAQLLAQLRYQSGYDDGYDAGYETARPKCAEGKKLVISFDDENFGNVLALAVRQALREPALARQMILFLKPLLQYLNYQTLWVIDRDISHYIQSEDSTNTAKLWEKFVVHVRVQMNHKKP